MVVAGLVSHAHFILSLSSHAIHSGATIRSIQEETGASAIHVPQKAASDNPEVRTVSIAHMTEEGALQAKRRIESILNSRPSYAATPQQTTIHVPVSITLAWVNSTVLSLLQCALLCFSLVPYIVSYIIIRSRIAMLGYALVAAAR